MEEILKIAKEWLAKLQVPENGMPILPLLMLAVFNEETQDGLELNLYDREQMRQEIISLALYSDNQVPSLLGLTDPERRQEVLKMLRKAKTQDQLREVLIMEVLYEAMRESLDNFPTQARLSPAEPFRGAGYL